MQMETFGDRVKQARESKGLRQFDLAELSGVSQVTISSIENSHRETYLNTAIRISLGLNVSLNWLATGEGNKTGSKASPKV